MQNVLHNVLDCGLELAVRHEPERRAEAMEIRLFAGFAHEPADKLGIANLTQQTVDKGADSMDGKALHDAFDAIGASQCSWGGREACGFTALCLPEYVDRCVELHAAMLRRPTFTDQSCEVAVELARQDLLVLQDDPQSLADKLIARLAYGPVLGRHVGGEKETLDSMTADDFRSFWRDHFQAGRMMVSCAGPVEPQKLIDCFERRFDGFGAAAITAREHFAVEFQPGASHQEKDCEQEQIALAMPGVAVDDPLYPVQRILIGVLSGGMSSRLFTEVREKRGLVYWVSAWHERPRGAGMIFVGASTTPQRCHETYETIIAELNRVGDDVTEEEVQRALTGIAVRADIRGDVTRALCTQQADDLFHLGRPVPWEEKLAQLRAVTVDDVRGFCKDYLSTDRVSVVTLGPRSLSEQDAQVQEATS